MENEKQFKTYTVQKVVALTNISVYTIRNDLKTGELKSEQSMRQYFIYPHRLKEYLLKNYPDRYEMLKKRVDADITINEAFKEAIAEVAEKEAAVQGA